MNRFTKDSQVISWRVQRPGWLCPLRSRTRSGCSGNKTGRSANRLRISGNQPLLGYKRRMAIAFDSSLAIVCRARCSSGNGA